MPVFFCVSLGDVKRPGWYFVHVTTLLRPDASPEGAWLYESDVSGQLSASPRLLCGWDVADNTLERGSHRAGKVGVPDVDAHRVLEILLRDVECYHLVVQPVRHVALVVEQVLAHVVILESRNHIYGGSCDICKCVDVGSSW